MRSLLLALALAPMILLAGCDPTDWDKFVVQAQAAVAKACNVVPLASQLSDWLKKQGYAQGADLLDAAKAFCSAMQPTGTAGPVSGTQVVTVNGVTVIVAPVK